MRTTIFFWLLAASCSVAAPVFAQDGATESSAAETERLEAETARINARAALINAQAELVEARVASLNLPSFSGETTLNGNAGSIEASILTSSALHDASSLVVTDTRRHIGSTGTVIVLAGGEALDFGDIARTRIQLDAIRQHFSRLGFQDPAPNPVGAVDTVPLAALSAIAGLVRQETEISELELSAFTDQLLAWQVAGSLGARAIIPSELTLAPPPPTRTSGDWGSWSILERFEALAEMRRLAQVERSTYGAKPSDEDKPRANALDAVIARYDTFERVATTASATGVVPISNAAHLERLSRIGTLILRVRVERAGGTITNSRNLATFFGVDPVKVSGGLIVSYLLVDPATGAARSSGIVSCRTTLTSIRSVQEGRWSRPSDPDNLPAGNADAVRRDEERRIGEMCDRM